MAQFPVMFGAPFRGPSCMATRDASGNLQMWQVTWLVIVTALQHGLDVKPRGTKCTRNL